MKYFFFLDETGDHGLNYDEPHVPFQVIKNKIYCNEKGEHEGWGLKVFP